jgi:4a-hydroxytetrahydrobiopterin dehydratase
MEVNLTEKKCTPCEGNAAPLDKGAVREYLKKIGSEWEVLDNKKIRKKFTYKDFKEALAFINEVGKIAEEEQHHPDIHLVSYKNVVIELWTHAIGGLSENDFIIAAKIESIR